MPEPGKVILLVEEKLVHQVRVARPLALGQDLDQVVLLLVVQVVHAVGVVPEDAEIRRRGLQPGEAAHRLVAVGIALGVGILGHAPDALDGLVLGHQLLHQVHLGAGGRHGHGDHLDAEILGDGEVAVVAGHGAQELHLVQLAPGRGAHDAVGVGAGHRVVHHVQAGIAVDDDVLGVVLHHVAQQLPGLLDAGQRAVVAAIGAVVAGQVAVGIQHVHHAHGQVQLLLAGHAAAHVQVNAHALVFLVFLFQQGDLVLQLLAGHFSIGFHSAVQPFPK